MLGLKKSKKCKNFFDFFEKTIDKFPIVCYNKDNEREVIKMYYDEWDDYYYEEAYRLYHESDEWVEEESYEWIEED